MKTTLNTLLYAGALITTSAFAASAAECPVGKSATDVMLPTSEAHTPVGVTDTVLASIDVAKEPAAIAGRNFRIRKLVVQPGGVVPWHDHANRPALIYILEGQITEYASTCSVPVEHKAGDVSVEDHTVKHWWQNNSDKPTVLISDDLYPVEMKDGHMM
jgi:quercetin dioxygenase-like cupin family protein